jgi:hypothetical protein
VNVAAAISYFILHPRKAIVASGTPHKAINTFGRPKSKILHQRICSTQLAGLFLPVKFIMIRLCPCPFVKYNLLSQLYPRKAIMMLEQPRIPFSSAILAQYLASVGHLQGQVKN